jgi:hypothetical protein
MTWSLPVILLSLALLACGGRTQADDANGGGQVDVMGGGGAGIRNPSETDWARLDSEVFCHKDFVCGRVASVIDCPPVREYRCTQTPAAIQQCLDEIRQLDCAGYSGVSARSCLPLRKSLDGC